MSYPSKPTRHFCPDLMGWLQIALVVFSLPVLAEIVFRVFSGRLFAGTDGELNLNSLHNTSAFQAPDSPSANRYLRGDLQGAVRGFNGSRSLSSRNLSLPYVMEHMQQSPVICDPCDDNAPDYLRQNQKSCHQEWGCPTWPPYVDPRYVLPVQNALSRMCQHSANYFVPQVLYGFVTSDTVQADEFRVSGSSVSWADINVVPCPGRTVVQFIVNIQFFTSNEKVTVEYNNGREDFRFEDVLPSNLFWSMVLISIPAPYFYLLIVILRYREGCHGCCHAGCEDCCGYTDHFDPLRRAINSHDFQRNMTKDPVFVQIHQHYQRLLRMESKPTRPVSSASTKLFSDSNSSESKLNPNSISPPREALLKLVRDQTYRCIVVNASFKKLRSSTVLPNILVYLNCGDVMMVLPLFFSLVHQSEVALLARHVLEDIDSNVERGMGDNINAVVELVLNRIESANRLMNENIISHITYYIRRISKESPRVKLNYSLANSVDLIIKALCEYDHLYASRPAVYKQCARLLLEYLGSALVFSIDIQQGAIMNRPLLGHVERYLFLVAIACLFLIPLVFIVDMIIKAENEQLNWYSIPAIPFIALVIHAIAWWALAGVQSCCMCKNRYARKTLLHSITASSNRYNRNPTLNQNLIDTETRRGEGTTTFVRERNSSLIRTFFKKLSVFLLTGETDREDDLLPTVTTDSVHRLFKSRKWNADPDSLSSGHKHPYLSRSNGAKERVLRNEPSTPLLGGSVAVRHEALHY